MWAPTAPRMTFAPPGLSSTLATSLGAATVTAELALVFAAVRSATASSTLRQRSQRLPQQEVDRRAVEPAVRRRVEHVQADAEAGVVEADLGQHARLGERREPAVLVLDDPDDGAGRGVRMPVPVLGEQPARADHRALRRPRPPRISVRALTARSSRSSTFAPAAIPSDLLVGRGGERDALALLAGVRAGRLGEHPAIERDGVRDRGGLRAPEGLTALVGRALSRPVDGERHPTTKAATSSWRGEPHLRLRGHGGDQVVEQLRPVTAADHLRVHRVGDVPVVAQRGLELRAATCRGSASGR